MGRFFQFLAFLFLVRFLWRAVSRLLAGPEMKTVNDGSSHRREPIYRGQMVRDPVCGVYIPQQNSLSERRDNKLYYFCSETCLETFQKSEIPAK